MSDGKSSTRKATRPREKEELQVLFRRFFPEGQWGGPERRKMDCYRGKGEDALYSGECGWHFKKAERRKRIPGAEGGEESFGSQKKSVPSEKKGLNWAVMRGETSGYEERPWVWCGGRWGGGMKGCWGGGPPEKKRSL